jgi:regulator of cell morphogenesis and NO signaling
MKLIMTEKTVAEMVREDYRIANVFKKWGINYCCAGNLPLAAVCASQQLDQTTIETELIQATQNIRISNAIDFNNWPIDFLIDYITNVHHAYLRTTIPILRNVLASFVPGHKKKYPYMEQVQETFEDLSSELLEHMDKEESVLFPYIKQVNHTLTNKEVYGPLFIRLLKKPFNDITIVEHQRIHAMMERLRNEMNYYSFAENACTRHQVIYNQLKELDADLIQHKHLENHLLFPKSAQMEKELLTV